jgi:hypothetical protein
MGTDVGHTLAIRNCQRLKIDLDIRRQILNGAQAIRIPEGSRTFWSWYCEIASRGSCVDLSEYPCGHKYPPVSRGVALWFSGGCESAYTLDVIRKLNPDLLRIEDFDLFGGEHRRHGQIHFLCAAIAAALGYHLTYLGVERNDLLLPHIERGGHYLERGVAFLDAWSAYLGDRSLRSVCRDFTKEEILRMVAERGLRLTGTCDNCKDGNWCGDCFKCYEAFYAAKAVGVSLPVRLKRAAFDRYYSEYQNYMASGFRDNVNNAQQFFLRLQVIYGVRFDREADCSTDGPDSSHRVQTLRKARHAQV